MKIIKTIKQHVKEKAIVEKVECDLCNKDVQHCRDTWESNQIIIEANLGSVYPEADCRTLYITDICAKCFIDRVMPSLQEIGVKFREISSEERHSLHE